MQDSLKAGRHRENRFEHLFSSALPEIVCIKLNRVKTLLYKTDLSRPVCREDLLATPPVPQLSLHEGDRPSPNPGPRAT